MKRLLLSLLVGVTSLQAVFTQLPNAEIMTNNLRQRNFEDVLKPAIVEKLAGRQKNCLEIAIIVEVALMNYCNGCSKAMRIIMPMRKPDLIRTILKGFSNEEAAVQECIDLGMLK